MDLLGDKADRLQVLRLARIVESQGLLLSALLQVLEPMLDEEQKAVLVSALAHGEEVGE